MKTYQTPQIGIMQFDFTVVLKTSDEYDAFDNLEKDMKWNF